MLHDSALAIHIASGATGLALGPLAMFSAKRRGMHTRAGDVYHWTLLTVAVSAIVLSALDWSEIWWFTPIAVFSYAFALVGFMAAKRRPRGWLPLHVAGQGGSYIALITALLVVNVGRESLIVWFIPTIVGTPLIAWVQYEIARGRRPKRGPAAA